jgi:hypothetical protein
MHESDIGAKLRIVLCQNCVTYLRSTALGEPIVVAPSGYYAGFNSRSRTARKRTTGCCFV